MMESACVRDGFPKELSSTVELSCKGWVGDTKCRKWEGAVLDRVFSEREPGSSGNSSGLVGLSLRGVRGKSREMGRSQIFKGFIYHSRTLGLYSESGKDTLKYWNR